MGWSIRLTSNNNIQESEIEKIVHELPVKFSSSLGNTKQPWGWSTGADIDLPKENVLRLGGSYGISGYIAEEYSLYLKQELEKRKHVITLKYNW